ncbi:hypothetical protein Tco_0573982 [Tanacetum coccineum]
MVQTLVRQSRWTTQYAETHTICLHNGYLQFHIACHIPGPKSPRHLPLELFPDRCTLYMPTSEEILPAEEQLLPAASCLTHCLFTRIMFMSLNPDEAEGGRMRTRGDPLITPAIGMMKNEEEETSRRYSNDEDKDSFERRRGAPTPPTSIPTCTPNDCQDIIRNIHSYPLPS